MNKICKKNNYIVTKSNKLVEAKYSLSCSELKLFLYVVSQIQPSDLELRIFSFKVKELGEILGVSNKNIYNEVKKISKSLVKKTLSIEEIVENTDKKPNYLEVSWFSSAEYINGVVEIELSKKLEPYLLQLKSCFTSYQLTNILKLKSKYSIRIYEILKKNQKLRYKTYTVEELRNILQIAPKTYEQYGLFKKKVLNVACNEISKNTDIVISFEEIKKERKVHAIKFFIESKNAQIKKEDKKVIESKVSNEIDITDLEESIKLNTLKKVIKPELPIEDLSIILNVANQDIGKVIEKYIIIKDNKNIRNMTKLLIDAILKDYQAVKSTSSKNNNSIQTTFSNFEEVVEHHNIDEYEEILFLNQLKRKQF